MNGRPRSSQGRSGANKRDSKSQKATKKMDSAAVTTSGDNAERKTKKKVWRRHHAC